MKEHSGENPSPKKPSRARKSQYPKQLHRAFMDSIAPTDPVLKQTQESTIHDLLGSLAESTSTPKEIVSKVIGNDETDGVYHGGELWMRMKELMEETETATGRPAKYTPAAFVETLRPFAEKEVETYRAASNEKRETQETDDPLEIDAPTKEEIKRHADAALQNPDVITNIIEEFMDGRRHVTADYVAVRGQTGDMANVREIADAFMQERGDRGELNGMMRSLERCQEESDALFPRLEETLPELGFSYGHGSMSTLFTHDVLFAFPDRKTRDDMFALQGRARDSIVSLEGVGEPDVPVLDEITVIDPTVLQTFNDNPFLKDMPFAERIPFARQIAPESFSEGGVFVDSYLNYVRFLAHLGIHSPEFYLDSE